MQASPLHSCRVNGYHSEPFKRLPINLTSLQCCTTGKACRASVSHRCVSLPSLGFPVFNRHGGAVRDGNLRLVNGEKTIYFEFGRLEVFLNGFWGNVCDKESFTPDSALVACRILGYDGGTSIFYYRDANGEHFHAIEQVLRRKDESM